MYSPPAAISSFFAKTHPKVRGELLYFPTADGPSLNTMANNRQRARENRPFWWGTPVTAAMTILPALCAVHQQFGHTVKVGGADGHIRLNNEAVH